ncbi:MAG: polysaccharide deacetylase family protein [Chloroflexi bacterium]|nr:MAG: polysaccharide deacetylase family protein [Chloroflexota bacterium]
MGWHIRSGRWLPLSAALVLVSIVPDTGLAPGASPAAGPSLVLPAIAAAEVGSAEPDGMVLLHNRPRPPPMPTSTPPTAQLLLAELHPAKAPVPSGPVTYVPILLYHYVRINPIVTDRVGFGLSTPPAMFRLQMQYLANHGFHVISLHQAVMAIKAHGGLPSRPVVLTFDDGYADFFTTAIPIMQSHGFTATDFVISGRMGQWSFMTPSQVVAADSMGFTIGAHTVDHVALATQSASRASWEIRTSKSTLESLLGHRVLDFAYPYGSYNGYDMAQAQSAGFETAVSTLYGTVHSPGQLFYLSRMRIGGGLPLSYFARVVGGPAPTASDLAGGGALPTPTPKPTATATPAPTPSPTPTPTPIPTASSSPVAVTPPRLPPIWL